VDAETAVVYPPNPKPAVCIPQPAKLFLAVAKLPPAVQADPSYSSVRVVIGAIDVL
jgi:hypothetical protein